MVLSLAVVGGVLFSGSFKEIRVWNIDADSNVHKPFTEIKCIAKAHNHWVRALTTNEKYLFSGSYSAIGVWDLETFENIRQISCIGGSVYSLAIVDKWLCCGMYDKQIHIIKVDSLELVDTLDGHTSTVYSVARMPGTLDPILCSGSYDNTIAVWDLRTGNIIQSLDRHASSVTSIVFSGDNMYSAAIDSTIRLWEKNSDLWDKNSLSYGLNPGIARR